MHDRSVWWEPREPLIEAPVCDGDRPGYAIADDGVLRPSSTPELPPKIDVFPPYIGVAMEEAHNGRFWFFPDDILAIDQLTPDSCLLTCRTVTGQGSYVCFAYADAITAAMERCRKRATHWSYKRDPVATPALLDGYVDARRWLKRAGGEELWFQNAPQDGREFVTWLYQRGACWIAVWDNPDIPTMTDGMLIGLPANPYLGKTILSMLNGAFLSDRRPESSKRPHVFWIWWD